MRRKIRTSTTLPHFPRLQPFPFQHRPLKVVCGKHFNCLDHNFIQNLQKIQLNVSSKFSPRFLQRAQHCLYVETCSEEIVLADHQGLLTSFFVTFALHVGRPQGEIVSEELHDQCGVLVALLGKRVQLGDSVVERSLH